MMVPEIKGRRGGVGGGALAKRKLAKMFNVQRISNCKRQQNIVLLEGEMFTTGDVYHNPLL